MEGWIGPIIKLGALVLVIVAATSAQWSSGVERTLSGDIFTVAVIAIAGLACLVSMIKRTAGFAGLAVATAFAAIIASTISVFTEQGRETGPAYPLLLAAFVLVIVGTAVSPVAPVAK